ncbi:sce7726 family protein [Variovorax sp.]|uniref:sce7726 family protein n=1 Tax=Variovorax sp. TaxID=1871043 RepID=UPI002D61BE93|nr:sce7726 family protein [Variovorax sp.]HYP82701.1 sce7726 family protein [Variovorax sp.]
MSAIAHDHQLRALLKVHLRARVGADDRVVDEFGLPYGAARADVALVNGHLEGFEIKAGRDTLKRLPAQVEAYNQVFEFSWVVTTPGHLSGVREVVPKGWGLLVAKTDERGGELVQVRRAQRNAKRNAEHLARLLWREEAQAQLEALGLSKGLKSKPKIALFAALAEAMTADALSTYVRTCLKSRANWRFDAAPRVCDDSSRPAASA